ncbi:MAG: 16S rRNA (cytosine(1402)-N(4))-methyltransferase RsmH [Deltaproteobacteria bacterium]|nr:16S rRNA (cytosine(1402)-N(4))-methyltransferase RsmH [Deltaproteobacteria bacterium]
MSAFHEPVMLKEVIALLNLQAGGIYVDGTVGGGGHASEILRETAPNGLLIGIDMDEEAIRESGERLKSFGNRKMLVKGNFADMDTILTQLGMKKVDGILLDLGVSSHQLQTAERGFSFQIDAPLDMRMDVRQRFSAYDFINTASESELEQVIKDYGEEPMARRIARLVSAQRKTAPIRTTAELAALIAKSLPRKLWHGRIHPATKTFQAIRIAVNRELSCLERAIESGTKILRRSGRFSIISFHSLEDRIVKNAFSSRGGGCTCPPDFPLCVCNAKPTLKVLTRKPVRPGTNEITANPRARSARLRTAERI